MITKSPTFTTLVSIVLCITHVLILVLLILWLYITFVITPSKPLDYPVTLSIILSKPFSTTIHIMWILTSTLLAITPLDEPSAFTPVSDVRNICPTAIGSSLSIIASRSFPFYHSKPLPAISHSNTLH